MIIDDERSDFLFGLHHQHLQPFGTSTRERTTRVARALSLPTGMLDAQTGFESFHAV
jgi:hypothetical protein